MGGRRKKDWGPVEEVKFYSMPERLPIYINGDKDITCTSIIVKKDGRRSGITLFYCKNKKIIEQNSLGRMIMGCKECDGKK